MIEKRVPPVPESEGPGGTLSKLESLLRSGPPALQNSVVIYYRIDNDTPFVRL
jgi:hypothetical protein